MEDAFQRELTQYSHKLVNERETSEFWQAKHSALNQTYLKADTDLRLLRSEFSSLASSREDQNRDITTRISSLKLDRDAFREAYNEAMGEIRMKEGEIKGLKEQVRGLKSFVSSNGKGAEQVTDEVVAEGMQRLGNGLQNWVISNFRRVKIGMFRTLVLSLFVESAWISSDVYGSLLPVQGSGSTAFGLCVFATFWLRDFLMGVCTSPMSELFLTGNCTAYNFNGSYIISPCTLILCGITLTSDLYH